MCPITFTRPLTSLVCECRPILTDLDGYQPIFRNITAVANGAIKCNLLFLLGAVCVCAWR